MVTLEYRLLGALCGSLIAAGCAGNIQIPPPAADNPATATAGETYDTTLESVLASGPAAPVPDRLDTRMQHRDIQPGMRHGN